MRILIIKKRGRSNAYLQCLLQVLQQALQEKGYAWQEAATLTDVVQTASGNAIFIVTAKRKASFVVAWLQAFKLRTFIKKHQVDLLVQTAGNRINNYKTKELVIVDNIEGLPLQLNRRTATPVVAYSLFAKNVIIDKGLASAAGIHVVPACANALYTPIDWSAKQLVKMNHAEGKEFFFTSCLFSTMEEFLQLLKAFSKFKRWQHSSMKLIIAGRQSLAWQELEENLATYKYRDDVVLNQRATGEEMATLLAAAYASLHLPAADNDVLPLVQSIHCNTPCICFETASVKEYAHNAAIMVAADDYEEFSQKMILLYKDENLRVKLVEACALHADEVAVTHTAALLQVAVQEAAGRQLA